MIGSIAVVGTGLIGTSIALAARQRGITVYLSDHDEQHARAAAARGAGLVGRPRSPVDLAVIAVPPSQVGRVLVHQQALGTAEAYTDVAAVKHVPERQVRDYSPEPFRYVGGHPMAGSEKSGPRAGRADLFRGRVWVLTPGVHTGRDALDRALELVEVCGAVPVLMESRLHDQRMALTSHVPHVMASLTAARLSGAPEPVGLLTGQGFRDTTRIAQGAAVLWSDILRANAAPVADVLADVQDDLTRLLEALASLASGRDRSGLLPVTDLLERGIAGAQSVSAVRPDPERLWANALAVRAALYQSLPASTANPEQTAM
jgi:prephenate dehydrogenase